MGLRSGVLFLAIAALLLPAALAQGTYTQVDYPESINTQCWGINTAGQISGTYWDTSYYSHGFLLSGGVYTTIDYPGAGNTFLTGINDSGHIVGYTDESGVYAGFVYDLQTDAFTSINYPGAYDTIPTSINNAGAVAGNFYFYGAQGQGFLLANSIYSEVTWPGSSSTNVWGISSSGALVGIAYSKSYAYISFGFVNGKYLRLTIPNATGAAVYGVNHSGNAFVGSYLGGEGFLYQNKVLQTVGFPGENATVATGVNGSGELVGYFQNNESVRHGFTWIPAADVKAK